MPVVSPEPQLLSSVWPAAADRLACVHCGELCGSGRVTTEAGPFCCTGCASVYTLLQSRGLEAFYTCELPAGVSQREFGRRDPSRFDILDDPAVRARFVRQDDGRTAQVTFPVPSLHCASCVWLLERLGRVDDRIGRTEVDLLRRTVTVAFESSRIRLSEVAAALAGVGYEPLLTGEAPRPATTARRRLYTQIGVAGFAFGNIMLFSIPRYANGAPLEGGFQRLFDALNIALALPVLVYSASDFFRGGWQALRHRTISLDVPIVIGLLALVSRSLIDIGTGRGEGYLDSFAGLVFFLLIGRLFQQQAFDWIGFDRTFRSFFPLSVLVERGAGRATPLAIDRLRPGDRIVLRPEEVVPVDARLVDARAHVDYAFLTGEREPVAVTEGGLVRAGGRLTRTSARFDVVREVSGSELAGLWARPDAARPKAHWLTDVSARFGTWFVVLALALAAVGFAVWWPDTTRGLEVATAVLIIACPCALTLAAPITLGTAMTMLGRRGWYLKDPAALLDLSRVDSVVFDKTGTLTASGQTRVAVSGLTPAELDLARALAAGSVHPISRALAGPGTPDMKVDGRVETVGRGLRGRVDGHDVAIGSAAFIRDDCGASGDVPGGGTVVAIDGVARGTVAATAPVRPGIESAVDTLASTCKVALLSGDRDAGDERWTRLFGARALFGQTAAGKREHVARLRTGGEHVLMVGDGLNDAGAFEAADIGLAVSDDTACLVPACDVVVAGGQLAALPAVLAYARRARRTIVICFVISVIYNAAGLSVALAGLLSPLVAAILMPVSSLTVVGTSVGLARWWARGVPKA
jgi:Cu+-exporting ATPase